MTTRINAFIVVLEHDVREDDVKATVNAIKQIKGVIEVEPHAADVGSVIARVRTRNELILKMIKMLKDNDE